MLPASCKYILCIPWNCQCKIQSHANIFPSFSLEAVVYSGVTLAEEMASSTKEKCLRFLKLERRWDEDCWGLGVVPPTSLTFQILQSCKPPLPPQYTHLYTRTHRSKWGGDCWTGNLCHVLSSWKIFIINFHISEVAKIYIRYSKLSNLFSENPFFNTWVGRLVESTTGSPSSLE